MTGREVAEGALRKLQQQLGGTPTCPICRRNDWKVSDQVGMRGSIDPQTNNVNPSSGIPGVDLICTNCGFVATFSPKLLGVM